MSGVSEAADMTRQMTKWESRGSGDLIEAMKRLEERYGLRGTFWSLRYRPPKSICTEVFLRIQAAYLAECANQERLFELERQRTRATNGFAAAFVRAAFSVRGEEGKNSTSP